MRHLLPLAFALPAAASLTLVLACGCAQFDPTAARHAQTEAFGRDLQRRAEALPARPLSLDDCVRVAMTNHYAARQADLRRELARIGRNVAFTAFLPGVAASAGYTAYARDPNVMTDRRFGSASLDAGLPIFMPSTWFLYAAARHGFDSAATSAFYVRQGIVLQTTLAYSEVLVQQDTVSALASQAQAARASAARVAGLAGEGFFQKWEADQAAYLAEAREAELGRARRRLDVVRGELLTGLGLSPLAPIRLSGDIGHAAAPTNDLPALVLQALERHPLLALADRDVVIREHEVRQAFCAFVPTLSLFASGTWTGNDLAAHARNWIGGLGATWTLFDGLANTARYKAARVRRTQAELERESTFLSVMLQVVAAHSALRDAAEAAHIRQRAYEVAAAKAADYDARSREGLIPLNDALDARAAMDLAEVALIQSRYQERLAVASLEMALGTTLVPNDPNPDEQP